MVSELTMCFAIPVVRIIYIMLNALSIRESNHALS